MKLLSISHIKQKNKQYYGSLDIKEVTDNKRFWKIITPHFGKGKSDSGKTMLLENNSIKTNKKKKLQQ